MKAEGPMNQSKTRQRSPSMMYGIRSLSERSDEPLR